MSDSKVFTTRHYLSYLGLIIIFGAGIWLMLAIGSSKHTSSTPAASSVDNVLRTDSSANAGNSLTSIANSLRENLRNSLSILLLQLVVIIVAARLVGNLFLKMGQPPVMGEIVAGILLGPSLLGAISPGTMAFLFPPASMEVLRLLSQIGVALFMFVVGLDLDVQHLRQKAAAAIMVSHASIVFPFFLGVALSLFLYRFLATGNTSFTAFALFMGIAMSITAFPVLARILEDRGMSQTPLGGIAITCAAVGDVTAWCLLPVVIAIARAGEVFTSLLTIGFVIVFIGIMVLVVKPVLAHWIKPITNPNRYSRSLVAFILALVLASALLTETIGIHALFGAFLVGVIIPPTAGVRSLLKEKLETFSLVVLLPLFFAFTGLRMQINLLNDWTGWLLCALVIAVAVAGKLGGSMFMARWTGMSWRDSYSLGVLLNTRGLVELIVLSIGYDLGILSARTFAMLVLMALVTTFMTGPLLSLVKFGKSQATETWNRS